MKSIYFILIITGLFSFQANNKGKIAKPSDYLSDIKVELQKEWPKNKTINLVFHGHSVPAGYFNTPVVNTFDAYPYQTLKQLKTLYPYAVINIINTSIGGEGSLNGEKRFNSDVLIHKPDVLFIDYALNDMDDELEKAYSAWNKMINKALEQGIKVILLTPSPDQRINSIEPNNILEQYTNQIKQLAKENGIGLVDSFQLFKNEVISGNNITEYMSQVNHPNKKGHQLIANEIMTYFE